MKIPAEMQATYQEISEIIVEYSREYLNEEYEELCLHALEKLCRKRPSNGLPIDARMLPAEMQRICYERGLIPYVYADKEPPE